MNILVTGGVGFIGGNFVRYMVRKYPHYNVTVIDKLTYAANPETLRGVYDKIQFIKGDICDRKMIDRLFMEGHFDVVINFAAESHVDRSIAEPEIFLKTNIMGVQVLMDACIKYSVSRFHQISTDEVYGDLPLERSDLFFREQSPIKPSSPYSASKASADLMTLAYFRTYGLPVTVSRCSNNYGPYQFKEKLIPLVISKALSDLPIPVYGSGRNIRDWLHTEDHCKAVDLIIHKGKAGEVYNIGGNNEKENIFIVKKILDMLEKPYDLITFVEDRKGHDLRYAVDYSKLQNELGWTPSVGFEEGLKKTVGWYVCNRSWWENDR